MSPKSNHLLRVFRDTFTLHYYVALKVIYTGLKLYRTAEPLYTLCRTVATGNGREGAREQGRFESFPEHRERRS